MAGLNMQIEEVRIDEISNHPTNPKIHPDTQIKLLQKSIKRFGWTNPVILAADNTILAGHARVKAAIAAGNDTVPAIRTKLTGKEADAYLLADNRLSDIAPYDRDILAELLSDLPKDLAEITGFDQVQVDALLSGEDIPDIDRFISDSQPEEEREEVDAEPQIDRAAELNKTWKVKPGDLWQLGDHRLICGDCTDPAVVERVMMGEKADLVLTDPPYGIKRDKGFVGFGGFGGFGEPIARRQYADDWDSDRPSQTTFNSLLAMGKTAIIFGGNFFADILPKGNHWVVWDKLNTMPTFGDCELAWTNIKRDSVKKITFQYNGLLGKEKERYHPTQKPVGLISDILSSYSTSGEIVADFFLGSGTTMIACENTGRKARGIEISPDYVAVCLQRFKDATGKDPVRINE